MPLLGIDTDPFINAVHRGIKRGIDVAIDNRCHGAAVVLIYAGIDAMGYTTLPPGREDVQRSDFIAWADKYMHFPGEDQVTGKNSTLPDAGCSTPMVSSQG